MEWNLERTVPSESLEPFLKNHNVSLHSTDKGKSGTTKLFYCKNRRKYSCNFRVKCLFSSVSSAVDIIIAGQHDHSDAQNAYFFAPAVIEQVRESVQLRLAPKQMRDRLKLANLPVPANRQLTNLIQRLKKTTVAVGPVNVWEFEIWCRSHAPTPDTDWHDVTVPIFDANPERLHIFITTKYLLSLCQKSDLLQVDATFKLNWLTVDSTVTMVTIRQITTK